MLSKSITALTAVVLLLTFGFTGCKTLEQPVSGTQIDSDYAGSIIFGPPKHTDDSIDIALFFQGGKWMENSGQCFSGAKVEREDRTLYLTMYRDLCSSANPKPQIRLDPGLSGWYEIIFVDPDGQRHPLTVITL